MFKTSVNGYRAELRNEADCGFAKVVTLDEIGANSGNLSIPLYVKCANTVINSNGDALALRWESVAIGRTGILASDEQFNRAARQFY